MKELLPNIYQATTRIKIVGPFKALAAMHLIKSDEEIILIDPFELPESETATLEALGTPTLILIAGIFHVRDAEAYRKRYGAKILANREAISKLGIAVDDAFGDGETLPGGLTTIEMPGTIRGETIFLISERGDKRSPRSEINDQASGTLIIGDALLNLQPGERSLFQRLVGAPENLSPMTKLFIKDKKLAAESYRKLLDHDFDRILVSHGPPILSGAKEQLEMALDQW